MDPRSRIFTLGHELGHLAIRESASCREWVRPARGGSRSVERWCERFGAALLLPEQDVRAAVARFDQASDTLEVARRVARRFKVSLRASALRLIELGLAPVELYTRVESVAPVRRAEKRTGGGGAPRPQRRLREYGPYLPVLVDDAVEHGRLVPRDAVELLHVPFDDYRVLAEVARDELAAR